MYEKVYNYQRLYEAYERARKAKRYRNEVLQFSYALEENLIKLQNELIWHTYKVGEYNSFIVHDPKIRQIVALPFKDRIIQHSLNAAVEPIFEKRMIYDSYACRVGKGTHAIARRISYFMGKPENYYYLKADIKAYFASINRDILRKLLEKRIIDPETMWLIDQILNSSPYAGLPLGNLMSQLFANVYLHELDHFVKNILGIKYYVRYMDDFLIFNKNKPHLEQILDKIRFFLNTKLGLSLNSKTRIGKSSEGCVFVGYRIWDNNKLIKKQSLKRMRRKEKAWEKGKISDDRYIASIGSWMGHSRDTSSHVAVEKLLLKSFKYSLNNKGN